MLDWQEYKSDFEFDGSWRDIYVLGTDISDWRKLIEFLHSGEYQCTYFMSDGNSNSIRQSASQIFQANNELSSRPVLTVTAGSIDLNCHFFSAEEIEFDMDPSDVKSEIKAEQIFDFMRQIGNALGKDVILTPENGPEFVIFKFSSSTEQIQYFPPRF